MKFDFKKLVPHLIAIVIFILISSIYFFPQFSGKKLYQGDIINHQAMAKEAQDYFKKTGEVTAWTNSMFGGMPTYQISAPQRHNYLKQVRKVLELGFARPAGYFILGMISFYILFLVLGFEVWFGIIGAIAFSFLTNNIFLYQAGHMTKLVAIMLGPLVLAGVILTLRKKYISGAIVFAMAMGLELLSNHPQMTYYLGMVIGILVIMDFVQLIKEKEFKTISIITGIFLLGVVLAVGSSASKLWTTYEYSKDTMRGNPILASEGKAKSSSQTKGLEWGYAMQWSNGILDLVSAYIPGVAGGGSAEKVSKSSDFAKKVKRLTNRTQKSYQAPLYWGSLPFTSGPPYMGALIFFLFVLGLFVTKGRFRWWALSSVVLLFILSLGKNFEFFNRLVFDYFPMYNKFRTPNSILGIAGIPLVFFAIYTLRHIVVSELDTKDFFKKLWIVFGIMGGISIFFIVLGPSLFEFAAPGDARYEKSGLVGSLISTRQSLMRADSLRTLIYVAIGVGLIWAFVKKKISKTVFLSGVGLVVLLDIIPVDLRYVSHNDFVKNRKIESFFKPRDVDKQILSDEDLYFRVLDTSIDPFNSAKPSYFHKNLGGYHAAKLQRAQDMIDKYIAKGNRKVLNMMNTKYIIQKQGEKEVAAKNTDIYGNAWFVNSIKKANNANEEIDFIASTDVKNVAIVNKEFDKYLDGFNSGTTGNIYLTEYAPNKLQYQTESSGDGFVVFSDVWYGPNKGWQAYIDGQPVDHIRVDYWLRGMKVPAGKHKIVFEFMPKSYYMGENISLISSLLMILAGLGYLFFFFYKRKETAR